MQPDERQTGFAADANQWDMMVTPAVHDVMRGVGRLLVHLD